MDADVLLVDCRRYELGIVVPILFSTLQVLDFSRDRMVDRANGILEFSVNHDFEETNVFHFWERYSSNATLGQHNTQPQVTKFMQDVSRSCHKRLAMCSSASQHLAAKTASQTLEAYAGGYRDLTPYC